MRCEETETKLLALMEEDLPTSRRVVALEHLQGCAACAIEFAEYRDLLALVQADPVPEPSPLFWEEFLPSLKRRIDQETAGSRQRSGAWSDRLRSWFAFRRPLIAGLAVAAVSILIIVRLPGFVSIKGDREETPASWEQVAGRGGEIRGVATVPSAVEGNRESGEPFVVAGEIVEDPSALAVAIQRLPWVGEIANQVETAWVFRPESDPGDWLASLGEEEQEILLDRMRSFRWSQS